MNRLALWSEPVSPMGGMVADGIVNLLGRPSMDSLTLLVREAAQNSWDARDARAFEAGQPVEFAIDMWQLTQSQAATLRGMGDGVPDGIALPEALRSGQWVMCVSDRGTTGLGGRLRSDTGSDDGSDFVHFVRDIGQPRDKEFGGGTYGYGKSAFYIVSELRTILIYSRCLWQGEVEGRLIGAALGRAYVREGKRYTGRHWWGEIASDGFVDPLRSTAAQDLATNAGLPAFAEGELGTSILVINPDLAGDPVAAARRVRDALLWNFWPRVMPDASERIGMRFRVSINGERLDVPHPLEHPRLRPFALALNALDGRSTEGEIVESHEVVGRDGVQAGNVAVVRSYLGETEHDGDREDASFDGLAHHVALMRQPRLVVRYLEGPSDPIPGWQFGGVFLASPAADSAFASAEPPTHDDWRAETLRARSQERGLVRGTLQSVAGHMDALVGRVQPPARESVGVPVARLADELATLLPAVPGTRISDPVAPAPGSPSPRRPRVVLAGSARPEPHESAVMVVQPFRVEPAGHRDIIVEAKYGVAINDGRSMESEPPRAVGDQPELFAWRAPDGTITGLGEHLLAIDDVGVSDRWELLIRTDGRVAVALDISVVSASQGPT